jgi:hypothetical protein
MLIKRGLCVPSLFLLFSLVAASSQAAVLIRKFKFACLALLGLCVHSVQADATEFTVVEPSFGAAVAGGGGFSYASTPGWTNNNDVNNNWFYNTAYTVNTSAKRPTPRTGNVALHGFSGYTSQILSDTFVSGRTYTFSIYGSGDTDSVNDSDRIWLYIYDGNTIPGPFAEGSELVHARYLGDGTADSVGGTGLGAGSATNAGWSIGDLTSTSWEASGGTWGELTLSYTATAAEDGHPIGVAFWGAGDAAVDDVIVADDVVIPEPSSLLLLGFGALGTLVFPGWRRRRQSRA